jgi:hypothetical protein
MYNSSGSSFDARCIKKLTDSVFFRSTSSFNGSTCLEILLAPHEIKPWLRVHVAFDVQC